MGDAQLNIKSAVSSGLVIAEPPVKYVFPGETGKIKVKYYTFRSGSFYKPISVHSNTKNKSRTVLAIKGHVTE